MTERSDDVKRIRRKLGLTQTRLGDFLGVSFATVNRWEKGRFDVPDTVWELLQQAASRGALVIESSPPTPAREIRSTDAATILDFAGHPRSIRTFAEGERLSFGHLTNPVFGTEV